MTKTAKALETLKAGGYFRKALERSYHGGEKFATRLHSSNGDVVKGIGAVTFYALLDAKALRSRECIRSSAYAQVGRQLRRLRVRAMRSPTRPGGRGGCLQRHDQHAREGRDSSVS